MAPERARCEPSLCSPGLGSTGMVGKRVASQQGVKLAGWPPALNHKPKFYALKDQGVKAAYSPTRRSGRLS